MTEDPETTKVFELPNGHQVVADSASHTVHLDVGGGAGVELTYAEGPRPPGGRQCGSCSLCCRLLPIAEIKKASGVKCPLARHREGGCCTVYATHRFPQSCGAWSCRWLIDPTLKVQRPDRAHYVVDVLPDFIQVKNKDEGSQQRAVLQIWVDPGYPDAHRDPRLRSFIADQAPQTGMAAIVRTTAVASAGLVLVPPFLTGTDEWWEIRAQLGEGVGLWSRPEQPV